MELPCLPWKSVGTMLVRPGGRLGVRSPKGLLPQSGSKLQLRFPIARDHVMILKFDSPFRIITGHKLVAL